MRPGTGRQQNATAGQRPGNPAAGSRRRTKQARRAAIHGFLGGLSGLERIVLGIGAIATAIAAVLGAVVGFTSAVSALGGLIGPQVRDGDDPVSKGCNRDAVVISQSPVLRSDGGQFGTLELRRSDVCHAAWGRIVLSTADDPANHRPLEVHITARRPVDHGSAEYPFAYGGATVTTVYGNLLTTRSGCVSAEAYLVRPAGQRGPLSRTLCER